MYRMRRKRTIFNELFLNYSFKSIAKISVFICRKMNFEWRARRCSLNCCSSHWTPGDHWLFLAIPIIHLLNDWPISIQRSVWLFVRFRFHSLSDVLLWWVSDGKLQKLSCLAMFPIFLAILKLCLDGRPIRYPYSLILSLIGFFIYFQLFISYFMSRLAISNFLMEIDIE